MVGAAQLPHRSGEVESLVAVVGFETDVLWHHVPFEAGDRQQRFDAASSAEGVAGLPLAAGSRRRLVGKPTPGVAESNCLALVVGAGAAGLTAALSIGDLGVIALFADTDAATLPMQVLRLMGAYRTDQAAGAAVVLMALALALFWICDQRGRAGAEL